MNAPLSIPHPPISAPYQRVRLGELAEHRLGKMLDKEKNTGTPRRYLRNPNIRWFEFDLSDLQEILVEDADVGRYELLPGDVLICEGGEAGRAAIWGGEVADVIFQKACHRVRVGPRLDARFLVHRLMYDYFSGGLHEYYTGTTIKHFTGQDLARYEFPLPPLDEQRRIAAILDKANALRRKRKRALEVIGDAPHSLFMHMFGDPEGNRNRWNKTAALSEVSEISSGITKGRKPPVAKLRPVPYLAVSNVQDHALDLTTVKTIDASEDEIARLRLQSGDLVLTEGGDPDKLGRGTVWRDELPEAIHQNHIFRVRADQSEAHPIYLSYLIGSRYGKNYFLHSAKQTTGIASINKTQLSQFPVVLPPIELQQRFAREVDRVSDVEARTRQAGAVVEALFASLQHRAFTGQL